MPGAFGERFPYTNQHDLNLDWIISIIKDFKDKYPDIVDELNKKLNAPVLNPSGEINQILVSNGDGTTTWVDLNAEYAPAIASAVDEWLTEHPEATTTVEDNSITMIKINDRLKLNIQKNLIDNLSFNPYFSYRHASTVVAYQSACEFDYENDHYLALGYFLNFSDLSGIMLFKNGELDVNKYGSDYGHVNTLTYCEEDNKIYVGATSGNSPLTHVAFKLDATTLENKEDLDYYSGVIQYYEGYFYALRSNNVYRKKYNDTNWELVYNIDTEGKTVQTFVIFNGYCYLQLLYDENDPARYEFGELYIKIYSPENKLVARYFKDILYEPEQLYIYNNQMYMLINEENIDASTYNTYIRATILNLTTEVGTREVVRNINYDKIFFSSNNGYGDGTYDHKTSSALACILSNKTIIEIGTAHFLPYKANLIVNKEFLGDSTVKPMVGLIGLRTNNARFQYITFTGVTKQELTFDDARVTFDNCVFDIADMNANNSSFHVRGAEITFNKPLFKAYFESALGRLAGFISYLQSTSGNIVINMTSEQLIDIKNATLTNGSLANEETMLFSPAIPIHIHIASKNVSEKAYQYLSTITLNPQIESSLHESGSFDLNKLMSNCVITFTGSVTLTNAPTGLTGRKKLVTEDFGTTNGKLQTITDETGKIYMRVVTGTNSITFDSSGNITSNYTVGNWIELH